MRTSISFNLTKDEAKKVRDLARVRGFVSTSEYLRFLLRQDDIDLISEDELVKRSGEVDRMYKSGKLIESGSLAGLLT